MNPQHNADPSNGSTNASTAKANVANTAIILITFISRQQYPNLLGLSTLSFYLSPFYLCLMPASPPPAQYRFTPANAREMSAKGHAAKAAKAALLHALTRLAAIQAANPPPAAPANSDDYVARVLARVRLQLDMIDERITILASRPKPDALELERLSRAATHLSERERSLSMRPTPGQLRPVAPRSSRSTLVAPSLPAPSLSTPLLNSAEKPASTSSADSSTSNPPLPPAPEHP